LKNRLIPAVRASEARGTPYLDEIYNTKGQNKTAAERNAESFIVLDEEEPRLSSHLQRESFDIKQVTVKKYGLAASKPQQGLYPGVFQGGWSAASGPGTKLTPGTHGNGWSSVTPINAWTKPLYDNRSQADTVDETNTLSDNQLASLQAEMREMKEQQGAHMEKLEERHEKNMQSMMENMSKMMTAQIAQMMTGIVKIIDERALIVVKQHKKSKEDNVIEDKEESIVLQQIPQSTVQVSEPESKKPPPQAEPASKKPPPQAKPASKKPPPHPNPTVDTTMTNARTPPDLDSPPKNKKRPKQQEHKNNVETARGPEPAGGEA